MVSVEKNPTKATLTYDLFIRKIQFITSSPSTYYYWTFFLCLTHTWFLFRWQAKNEDEKKSQTKCNGNATEKSNWFIFVCFCYKRNGQLSIAQFMFFFRLRMKKKRKLQRWNWIHDYWPFVHFVRYINHYRSLKFIIKLLISIGAIEQANKRTNEQKKSGPYKADLLALSLSFMRWP